MSRLLFSATFACLAAATGCSSAGWAWAPRQYCLDKPGDYEGIVPAEEPVDESGIHTGYPAGDAKVAVRVERKDCWLHLHVRTPKGSASLGPFDSVDLDSFVASLDKGRYSFIAVRGPDDRRIIVDGLESGPYRQISKVMFSANGAHFAYAASTAGEAVISLDGQIIARGALGKGHMQLLAVLDDGRAVFSQTHPEGSLQLVAGAWKSDPFDQIYGFAAWRGVRFAAMLGRGDRWQIVIDGRVERLPGQPTSNVIFSDDGAHVLYVVYQGDPKTPYEQRANGYVAFVDGVGHQLPDDGYDGNPSVVFWADVPVMTLSTPSPRPGAPPPPPTPMMPARDEHGIWIIGHSAPAAQPPPDDFTRANAGRKGSFAVIGKSRGPQFDQILAETLYVDEKGRLHYRATRGRQTFDVVDNVIQMLPLTWSPPALQVPDALPPVQKAAGDPAPQPP